MKNNIDTLNIYNRKIIIEIRFTPIPKFLDLKGTLISSISRLGVINNANWGIGDSAIKLSDSVEDSQVRTQIHVEMNRFSLVSTKIDSLNDYFSKFEKTYKAVQEILGEFDVSRIGCRIQGTYKTKSTEYSAVLKSFESCFKSEVFIKDYPLKDLRLQINYQNGYYHIGPIKKGDPFLKSEFTFSERNDSIGFGIDTDNYMLKTDSGNFNNISIIKDVFIASLAVEKSLVENFKEF